MNIHEHQAKQILKKYGVVVPEGVFAFSVEKLVEKAKLLKTEKFVLTYCRIVSFPRRLEIAPGKRVPSLLCQTHWSADDYKTHENHDYRL